MSDVKAEQLVGQELLIVGSPTRGFRPSPATSKLLGRIPSQGLSGVKVAAFDTRMDIADVNVAILRFLVRLFGYAAPHIARGLQKRGGELAVPAEGFIVKGSEGPHVPPRSCTAHMFACSCTAGFWRSHVRLQLYCGFLAAVQPPHVPPQLYCGFLAAVQPPYVPPQLYCGFLAAVQPWPEQGERLPPNEE